jgi:hypothetical protein
LSLSDRFAYHHGCRDSRHKQIARRGGAGREDEAMIGTHAHRMTPSMRRSSSIAPAASFRVPALLPIGA